MGSEQQFDDHDQRRIQVDEGHSSGVAPTDPGYRSANDRGVRLLQGLGQLLDRLGQPVRAGQGLGVPRTHLTRLHRGQAPPGREVLLQRGRLQALRPVVEKNDVGGVLAGGLPAERLEVGVVVAAGGLDDVQAEVGIQEQVRIVRGRGDVERIGVCGRKGRRESLLASQGLLEFVPSRRQTLLVGSDRRASASAPSATASRS